MYWFRKFVYTKINKNIHWLIIWIWHAYNSCWRVKENRPLRRNSWSLFCNTHIIILHYFTSYTNYNIVLYVKIKCFIKYNHNVISIMLYIILLYLHTGVGFRADNMPFKVELTIMWHHLECGTKYAVQSIIMIKIH